MNLSIETICKRLQLNKCTQEWIWFLVLWSAGLASVFLIALFIKLLMIAL